MKKLKIFKKSDLQNRMVVETNTDVYIVIDDRLVGEDNYIYLSSYDENLDYTGVMLTEYEAEIIRVYEKADSLKWMDMAVNGLTKCLWERLKPVDEVKELTIQEIEDKLGYKVKIVKEKSE